MKTLTVAGAQMAVTEDVARNEDNILRLIDQAKGRGADILLTPEGSLSGYSPRFDRRIVDQALDRVVARAAAAGIGLALGTCFYESDQQCYNELRFYDRDGTHLGSHAKILRCEAAPGRPGSENHLYGTHELRTFTFDGWRVAGLICNDLWANPEATQVPDPNLVRQCAQAGAQIIFHAVNGGRGPGADSELAWQFHESNLRMRAKAAEIYIVTVDNALPETLPTSSPGGVIAPDGSWLAQTSACGEDMVVHTLPERASTDAAGHEFQSTELKQP